MNELCFSGEQPTAEKKQQAALCDIFMGCSYFQQHPFCVIFGGENVKRH